MVLITLDGIYPSFIDILTVSGIFLCAIFAQVTISSILLEKYQQQQVYSGYYLTTTLAGFISGQVIFGEVLSDFNVCFLSLIIATVGSLILSMENIKEKLLESDHSDPRGPDSIHGEHKGK